MITMTAVVVVLTFFGVGILIGLGAANEFLRRRRAHLDDERRDIERGWAALDQARRAVNG